VTGGRPLCGSHGIAFVVTLGVALLFPGIVSLTPSGQDLPNRFAVGCALGTTPSLIAVVARPRPAWRASPGCCLRRASSAARKSLYIADSADMQVALQLTVRRWPTHAKASTGTEIQTEDPPAA
jgi:hypothetical protein